MSKKIRLLSSLISSVIIISISPSYAVAKPTPLPGVMAVDLYMNLEKQGWKCARPHQARDIVDPTKFDKNKTTFDCFSKDKNAYAIAWGTTSSNLIWITADALTKANYGWLGFISTLPINGVDQAAAQKWVMSVASGKKTTSKLFGNIKFTVTAGSGVARTLSIAHKSTKQP
jgi:hypothetical protein